MRAFKCVPVACLTFAIVLTQFLNSFRVQNWPTGPLF